MRSAFLIALVALIAACETSVEVTTTTDTNPVFNTFNEPIDFAAITADDLIEATDSAIAMTEAMLEEIYAVSDEARTFENTMVALDQAYGRISNVSGVVGLMAAAHPDSLIRTTAQQKDTEISQYYNQISLNEDLYKAVKAYSESEEAQGLNGWKAKFTRETVRDFERNGFALPESEREMLKAVLDEISEIGDEFNTNINNAQAWEYFTKEELDGLSDDYLKARLQEDSTYKVGVSYPDVRPLFRNCTVAETRKKVLLNYTNRAAPENLEVLKKLIAKRTERAKILGYDTYAEYQLGDKMAEEPENVWEFQSELKEMVTPKGRADIAEMVEYQQTQLGIDKDYVEPWSRSFVIDKLMKDKYGVDVEEVRQYFPLENVVDGLFRITQNLFGLEYKKVEDASVWHDDVELYEVFEDGELIGRFYLDLHPRPNKYNHAACFPIIIGRNTPNGFQLPTSSLECNFTAPTEDKPALMTHDEVETFFHEFGHVLHSLVTKAEIGVQSGFYVARDFIEAPSQIFENWVWNYESLSLFAEHYETGEPLPKELFDKMLAAKNVMSGRNTLFQIFLGTLDMTLYDGFDVDGGKSITEVREALDREININEPMEGSHMAASFGHLNGYGASYYGYLWSKVFAQDMFSRFEEEGIMNSETGADYKNIILAQGATKDEMDMLVEFLGREPKKDAFIRSLGLE